MKPPPIDAMHARAFDAIREATGVSACQIIGRDKGQQIVACRFAVARLLYHAGVAHGEISRALGRTGRSDAVRRWLFTMPQTPGIRAELESIASALVITGAIDGKSVILDPRHARK